MTITIRTPLNCMDAKNIYCKLFGFDSNAIDRRIRLLELSKDDEKTAKHLLAVVIEPNAALIVYNFYAYITKHEELSSLTNIKSIDEHKKILMRYLLSFGKDFYTADYFNSRIITGISHGQIGLNPSLCECVYRKLQGLIAEHIPEELEPKIIYDLNSFINKIIALDLSIALASFQTPNLLGSEKSSRANQDTINRYAGWPDVDPLTRCLNRSHILMMLNKQMISSRGAQIPAILLFVEGLTAINDGYGFLSGDYVLSSTIAKVLEVLDKDDHIGRLGGEIFLLLPSSNQLTFINYLINKVAKTISSHTFMAGTNKLNVSVTVISGMIDGNENMKEALKRLDKALLVARKEKRNA